METENGREARFPWEMGLEDLGGEGSLTWQVMAVPRGCCKVKPHAATCRQAAL